MLRPLEQVPNHDLQVLPVGYAERAAESVVMAKRRNKGHGVPPRATPQRVPIQRLAQSPMPVRRVDSLFQEMADGAEYNSLMNKMPKDGHDLLGDVVHALKCIEDLRARPCIAYLGNVVRADNGSSGVDQTDDLPFAELVNSVPGNSGRVDVLLSTRGGSAQQVGRFVDCLRRRFDEVDFLIPSYCMSAGTLFALSGDRLWMTERACLGPIDPQVPSSSGMLVPAQALLVLVKEIQKLGQDAIDLQQPVPWHIVRIIDTIDKHMLGEAITATGYATRLATEYLKKFKFKNWTVRSETGIAVTDDYKQERATEIATQLASHELWQSHGHAISRDVLQETSRLQVDRPNANLDEAMRRAWAIATWIFERTAVVKMLTSSNYRYAKTDVPMGVADAK